MLGVSIGLVVLAAPHAYGQVLTVASSSPSPTIASPIDASVDQLVGCNTGGHLYFQVGAHRVKVDPKLWKLRVNPKAPYVRMSAPIQACQSAPLLVRWLQVMPVSSTLEGQMTRVSPTLADGTDPEFKKIRADFLPHESACRRRTHWTWCGTEKSVHEDEKTAPDGASPYVSLKFDLDFYRTPTGGTFFVSSRGDAPLYLSPWGVAYRWDETLVIGYRAQPCKKPLKNQKPDCSPMNLIELDRQVHSTVRSLLDASRPVPARQHTTPSKPQPSAR